VILATEARCLAALPDVPMDAATVALLCRRSLASILLIRNLTTWAPCPPVLLVHLSRQTLVRRNPALKAMILRHPNCPGQLKRA
jgi:hypothetical protein